MARLTLAEKILSLVTYLNESQTKTISDEKLKEVLGKPAKATYYRILSMLLNGGASYRPLLIESKESKQYKVFKYYFSENNDSTF
jgi:hypothetical protein